jgi:hypothetical protein
MPGGAVDLGGGDTIAAMRRKSRRMLRMVRKPSGNNDVQVICDLERETHAH